MNMKSLSALLGFAGMALAASASASTVFAADIRGDRFVSFDHTTPSSQTVLATGFTPSYFGLDFDASQTNLYALRDTAVVEQLNLTNGAILNTTTITGSAAGGQNLSYTGLTFDPFGNGYLSTFLTGVGSQLHTYNASTGATTLIGLMDADATRIVIDIAARGNGEVWAHSISNDAFGQVNISTGATTWLPTHGLAANFAQGMDFDWSTDTLIAAVYTGGGTNTYGTVNLTTGAVTSLGAITSGEYEMAIQAVPEPATTTLLALGALAARRRRKS